jgi:hypothetical protein
MIRATLRAACCLGAIYGVLACAAAKQEEAEVTYLGQSLSCVRRFRPSRSAIDKCRADVDARWGVGLDAGPPPPKPMQVEDVYPLPTDGGPHG